MITDGEGGNGGGRGNGFATVPNGSVTDGTAGLVWEWKGGQFWDSRGSIEGGIGKERTRLGLRG